MRASDARMDADVAAMANASGARAPSELPAPAARYAFDELADGKTPNAVDAAKPATTDRARPEQLGAVALGGGKVGRALAFDGDGGVSLAGLAGFTRHDPVSVAFWIKPGEKNARAAVLHTSGFYTNEADALAILYWAAAQEEFSAVGPLSRPTSARSDIGDVRDVASNVLSPSRPMSSANAFSPRYGRRASGELLTSPAGGRAEQSPDEISSRTSLQSAEEVLRRLEGRKTRAKGAR
jgi:hypothetical protein